MPQLLLPPETDEGPTETAPSGQPLRMAVPDFVGTPLASGEPWPGSCCAAVVAKTTAKLRAPKPV